ncbi:hypothetical protein B566_EDAN012076 [Ephemera danica]|nr:hypothetical protein B566_EDAN012076 [Ephemera danica]
MAVGAYRSGHAVLLRSQPIVQISVEIYPLRVPPDGLPRNATTLQLRTCPSYSGASLPRTIASAQVVFATECGTDNLCKANVTASLEFVDVDERFVVGSSPSLTLRVTVSNAADNDPAYNTRVEITLPTPIQQYPMQCNELSPGTLSCDVGNPLNPGTSRDLDIVLDVQHVSVSLGSLNFSSNVFTSSVNQADDQSSSAKLALRALADITVSGKAGHEVYNFDTTDAGANRKRNVTFSVDYQVEKFGPSPIDWVLLAVDVPVGKQDVEKFTQITEIKVRKYFIYIHNCSLHLNGKKN